MSTAKLLDHSSDSIAKLCLTELKFMDDKCELVHGDVSINNIIIVRFLPNILAASSVQSLKVASSVLESSTTGQVSADSTLSSSDSLSISPQLSKLFTSLNPNAVEGYQPISWDTKKAWSSNGLPYNLSSGGSVIDYDYAHEKNTLQSTTSVCPAQLSYHFITDQFAGHVALHGC